MSYWIISANPGVYNHSLAFAENGFIRWKQTRRFQKGDIVYIYVTKPVAKVRFKAIVQNTGNLIDIGAPDERYWNTTNIPHYSESDRFMTLKLIAESNSDKLSLESLREMGFFPPQSPTKMNTDLITLFNKEFEIGERHEG